MLRQSQVYIRIKACCVKKDIIKEKVITDTDSAEYGKTPKW